MTDESKSEVASLLFEIDFICIYVLVCFTLVHLDHTKINKKVLGFAAKKKKKKKKDGGKVSAFEK